MMIDTHCHLASKKYTQPIEKILASAKESGVEKFITVGTSFQSNLANQDVAKKHKGVYFTAGVYPHEEMDMTLKEIKTSLKAQLKTMPDAVAIGECGIDITDRPNQRSLEDQIELFEIQIQIALENNLPIIIHNRNGDQKILQVLKKYNNKDLKGVMHTFTSSWETAKTLLELGFYISFSGIITYPSGKDILETVKNVPMDKFLIETDAPYLAPQPVRGQINKPEYVKITAQKIAEVKDLPLKEIEKSSYKNALKLFNLPKN